MWSSYHKSTTHNDADCRARSANGLNNNAHFAQVRPPSVRGICSSWDLPVRNDSGEKPCIYFSAREIQPATKPAQARVEEDNEARPFGPVFTAGTEGWRIRHLRRVLSPNLRPRGSTIGEGGDTTISSGEVTKTAPSEDRTT